MTRTIDRKMRRDTTAQPRQDTLDLIRSAGLALIYERGYEGMGLRSLASEAGIGQSTLYGHYATKQDLLVDLICRHMEELLAALKREVPANAPPMDRFLKFVRFHLGYHIRRRREVFICYSELRSLEPENYARVTALRQEYERFLMGILSDGADAGVMRAVEPRIAAYGILAMLSGITHWYRPDGELPEERVQRAYVELALAAVVDPLGVVLERQPFQPET